MSDKRSAFGLELEGALREALAWKRGELALPVRQVDPMPPEQVRQIYKSVAKSARDFEQKFHVPASTLNNWLQGRRKPDPASRAYLTVIAHEPEAVARALQKAARAEVAEAGPMPSGTPS